MHQLVASFYTSTTGRTAGQLDTIRTTHSAGPTTDLRQRAAFISQIGEWGGALDVSAYATITNTIIRTVVVVSPLTLSMSEMNSAPINPDGTENWQAPTSRHRLYFDGVCHWSLYQER